MAAGKLDIYIEQCSDFSMTVCLKKTGQTVDLTGHVFRGQIRKTVSTRTLTAELSFDLQDQTMLATQGKVRVYMTGANTAKIACDPSPTFDRVLTKYTWDMYSTAPDGSDVRWLQGVATISPSATNLFPAPVTP